MAETGFNTPGGIPFMGLNWFANPNANVQQPTVLDAAGSSGIPVLQDLSGIANKVGTTAGVLGAGLWDTGADIVKYLTGMEGTRLMPGIAPYFEQAWGMNQNPVLPSKPAAQPSTALPAQDRVQTPPLGVQPPAPQQPMAQPQPQTQPQQAPAIPTSPTAPPVDIESERARFMTKAVEQIGFNPLQFNPIGDAYSRLKAEYEQRYGPIQDWVNGGTGNQFRADLAVFTQQNQEKQQTAITHLKFALEQFDKDIAPIILKSGDLAYDRRTKQTITNQPPVTIANEGAIYDPGSRTMARNQGPVETKQGAITTMPNGQQIQGLPMDTKPEAMKIQERAVVGNAIKAAKARYEQYKSKWEGAKDDAAKVALRKQDPLYGSVEVYKNMELNYPAEFNKGINSDSFIYEWLKPEDLAKFNENLRSISQSIRGSGIPTSQQGQPQKPVVGSIVQDKTGKRFTVTALNPDGTIKDAVAK